MTRYLNLMVGRGEVQVKVTPTVVDLSVGDFYAYIPLPYGVKMFLTQFSNGAYTYLQRSDDHAHLTVSNPFTSITFPVY